MNKFDYVIYFCSFVMVIMYFFHFLSQVPKNWWIIQGRQVKLKYISVDLRLPMALWHMAYAYDIILQTFIISFTC